MEYYCIFIKNNLVWCKQMLKCQCGCTNINNDEWHETVYRCFGCNKIGSEGDFND